MASQTAETEEPPSEDHQAKSKYLLQLQNENELLQNELEEKSKLHLELEREIQLKESKLEDLLSLVDQKLRECVSEDLARKKEIENEKEWKDNLKAARIQRMASILEYKNKMAELREQVFSPLDLDDAKINEEISHLMSNYEELTESNKLLQLEIVHLEKRMCSETDVNEIIDSIALLTKQLKSETENDRKLNDDMYIGIMKIDKKIRENVAVN